MVSGTLELNQPSPSQFSDFQRPKPLTASIWFGERFPASLKQYGVPFVELKESSFDGFSRITPISLNIDFFASVLGGDPKLGHSVVYYEPEMQFYFKMPIENMYKPTTPEKLQNLYRGWLMRCAQELPEENNRLNLCVEFRSDKTAKAVVQRAKSVLAADSSFFSPTSPHQRINGPELFARLIRVLCETMLERREGACLTVSDAYRAFCHLSKQRQLGQLKRSMFKETMRDLVKDVHGLGLRRDVPDAFNKQQEAWKGLKLVEAEVLAA